MEVTLSPIDLVIAIVGSASELARRLGITPSAVLQWDEIPARRVLAVEEVSGISRHILREDLYGPLPPPRLDSPAVRFRAAEAAE